MRYRDLLTITRIGAQALRKKTPYYPIVASFDVTNRCTLRCKHCYWWMQAHERELTDDEFLAGVQEIKQRHPTLISGVWLGGEPLLRQELVARCKTLFSFNEVITNGTLPLPYWPDVRFACSVDGTKPFQELQRGRNSYNKIKKNIDRPDLSINIICILTRLNEQCLEAFVEEWRTSAIRSMGFAFYTPILGKVDNEAIWLDFKERDKVMERLLKLKKKYPRFINTSEGILRRFRSDVCVETTRTCRRDYVAFNGMCFDALLKRKFPCVIGETADCDRCGCVASVMGEALKSGDTSFILEHIRSKINLFNRKN